MVDQEQPTGDERDPPAKAAEPPADRAPASAGREGGQAARASGPADEAELPPADVADAAPESENESQPSSRQDTEGRAGEDEDVEEVDGVVEPDEGAEDGSLGGASGGAGDGQPAGDASDARGLPEGLWERLKSDPTHAPQHLALAAVERWGEQARDYAERVRTANPNATNRELAGMVKARHGLLARMEGASAGLPGSFAPVVGGAAAILPDMGALAWIQSRMVVHIAAVYGHDTTDPEMAAELLVLQGFYNTTEAARVALAEAGKRVAKRLVNRYLKGGTLVLIKELSRYVGIKFTRTGTLKYVPYVGVPISAVVNEGATRSLANRAMSFYDLDPRKSNG